MASFEIKSGALVSLQDLRPSSPFFKQGASLRVIGKLHEYSSETGLAIVIDGNDTLKVSTEHLRDLTFQVGGVYQFIGELQIQPDNEDMTASKDVAVRYELGLSVHASRGHLAVHVKVCDKLKSTLISQSETW